MSKVGGHLLRAAGGMGLTFVLFAACSPSAGSSDAKLGSTTGGKKPGSPTIGNLEGGSSPFGSEGGGFQVNQRDAGSRTGDGALTRDGACGSNVMQPEAIKVEKNQNINCTATAPQPLVLYIMLDNSGSMDDFNKWNDAVAALTQFVQSDTTAHGSDWTCTSEDGGVVPTPSTLPPPGAGTISIAIQYFHPQNPPPNSNTCDGTAHGTPAVPVGPLPDNGQAIIDSLGQTHPNGNTPTEGALKGGTQFCSGYQTANADKKCVVVLITDGLPNGCSLSSNCPDGGNNCFDPKSTSTLVPIAQNAHDGANSVTTFTIGMQGVTPAGFGLLDAIAAAGGSDCDATTPGSQACNITSGGAQGFLDALNTIRKTVQVTGTTTQTYTTTEQTTLACQWLIPKPEPGKTFDKNLVNVNVTIDGKLTRVGNVQSEADCAAAGEGWYYDDPAAPKQILTCPALCDQLKSATKPQVEVLVGCATEPAIFH